MAVAVALLILLVAALLCALMPPAMRWGAMLLTAAAAAGAPLALLIGAARSPVGMHLSRDFGELVPGIDFVTAATPASFALVVAVAAALVLTAIDSRFSPRMRATFLLGGAGGVLAACAGDVVLLAGGVEMTVVATLLMAIVRTGRVPRGAVAAFFLSAAAVVLLLVAAVQLQSSAETGDFSALPAGAVSNGIAQPWMAAVVLLFLAPVFVPATGGRRAGLQWAACGVTPAAIAAVVHLHDAADGVVTPATTVLFAIAGCLTGLLCAGLAWRYAAAPSRLVRCLIAALAGPLLAAAGIAGPGAWLAVGAAAFGLLVMVNAAPLFDCRGRAARYAAAIIVGATAGLGVDAAALCVGAITGTGGFWPVALAVLVVLMGVMTGAAVLRGSWHLAVTPPSADSPPAVLIAVIALLVATFSLLPGIATSLLERALELPLTTFDPFTVTTTGVSWPGGILVAWLLLGCAAVWAAGTLLGRALSLPAGRRAEAPRHVWAAMLGRTRRYRTPFTATHRRIVGADTWLAGQPQFGIAVLAAALALVVIR